MNLDAIQQQLSDWLDAGAPADMPPALAALLRSRPEFAAECTAWQRLEARLRSLPPPRADWQRLALRLHERIDAELDASADDLDALLHAATGPRRVAWPRLASHIQQQLDATEAADPVLDRLLEASSSPLPVDWQRLRGVISARLDATDSGAVERDALAAQVADATDIESRVDWQRLRERVSAHVAAATTVPRRTGTRWLASLALASAAAIGLLAVLRVGAPPAASYARLSMVDALAVTALPGGYARLTLLPPEGDESEPPAGAADAAEDAELMLWIDPLPEAG